MRVLHYAESFSPLSETFIYDYVTELERQGVDNHVVTHHRLNSDDRPFPKVHVVDRPSRWHPRRLWHRALVPFGIGEARTSDWLQVRGRLAAIIRKIEPDVIHAHFGPAAVLIKNVATRLSIPLVATFYGYDISSLPSEDFWKVHYAKLWSATDAVTVLSEEMKEAAQKLGCSPKKLNVVHLSRDLDQFKYRPPTPPIRSILFVGRLVAKKAPLDAVRAVQLANEQGANLHLDIVGDGNLRDEVEEYVQENGLTKTVTLHGRVPNQGVQERMREADAFFLPSKTAPNGDREGTPTVLVEAQAIGLPCVTTAHAGIPEMIPKANCNLLAREDDVSGIAQILTELTKYPIEKLAHVSEQGRRKVEREFSLTRSAMRLRNIYEAVIQ